MMQYFNSAQFSEALETLVKHEEFQHWSARSRQETIASINAACEPSRNSHRQLAILCVRQALACIPAEIIVAWMQQEAPSR